jgi:hypothetical protein
MKMHYRNGREAKNGDVIVQLPVGYGNSPANQDHGIWAIGVLFNATPDDDYCNGSIAPTLPPVVQLACLCDCLHVDDLAAILKAAGMDKRPAGK